MDKKLKLVKLKNLKKLFDELKEQYNIFNEQEDNSIFKKTALFAVQKKLEEVIEYSIKINKIILKEKNEFSLSYQESFLKLEIIGINSSLLEKLAQLAYFRNKLAHDYLIISKENTIENVEILLKYFPKYFNEVLDYINKN